MKYEGSPTRESIIGREHIVFDRKAYDRDWNKQKEKNTKKNASLFNGLRNGHYYINGQRMKQERTRLAAVRKELAQYV